MICSFFGLWGVYDPLKNAWIDRLLRALIASGAVIWFRRNIVECEERSERPMLTLLDRAANLYGLPASILRPVRGGHFSRAYGYTRHEKSYIFRITPPNDDINLARMLTVLDWMDFLTEHGAPVPRLVRSQQGSLLEVLEQDDGEYLVVMSEAAPGVLSEEFPLDRWNDYLFSCLGRSVGKMHALAKGYTPPRGDFPRPVWHTAGQSYTPPPEDDPAQSTIRQKRLDVIRYLQTLPRDLAGYGITHADLHFGNFFVDAATDTITIFDFDDCAYGWYILDIAMLLHDVLVLYAGADREAFAARFLRALLQGYRQEKLLDPFWIRQMPYFLKLLEGQLYQMVYRFYEAGDADGWVSKFMPGRKARIENDVPYIALDFEKGDWLA